MVPTLMQDLFIYLRDDHDVMIIKSCVFHYEIEFIHPFEDGNGRMGRYWQTRLMEAHPIFEYIPIEETIKQHQAEYYHVLAEADRSGNSTVFIEYMLDAIHTTLRTMLEAAKIPTNDVKSRAAYAFTIFKGWFDRKVYMKVNTGISPATASRDLRYLVNEGILEVRGKGRMTQYRKK